MSFKTRLSSITLRPRTLGFRRCHKKSTPNTNLDISPSQDNNNEGLVPPHPPLSDIIAQKITDVHYAIPSHGADRGEPLEGGYGADRGEPL